MDDLWTLVKKIPPGRVTSYGALGSCLNPPLSGFLVGRTMARCPADVPWWRVVAKNGRLPINKRAPHLAREQVDLLQCEGTTMADESAVDPSAFVDPVML